MSKEETPPPCVDPPKGFLRSVRYMGPGLILSAAIVGSGELIATTSLGAKAGFSVLWVILLGCLIKVAVQLQFGRHAIMHGETSFIAWNNGPGLRLLGIHWSVYCAVLYLLGMLVGQGGVLGGAAQAVHYAFPTVRTEFVVAAVAAATALMVIRGKYREIEITATLFNAIFVSLILFCVIAVQRTEYAFGLGQIAEGFSLRIPPDTLTLALTAFGITGLSAGEIFVYPTWCIEKGYAAWTGPRDDSPEWAARAQGWMRVMTYDAVVSMVVYTVTTVAFYFLGASVLEPKGEVIGGQEEVLQLSKIFTEVLGGGATNVFMAGAFMVLFSTLFANVAGHSRLWIDFMCICRLVDDDGARIRKRALSILVCVMPVIWGLAYLAVKNALALVIVLGVTNCVFLLVVAYQALVFRYRRTEARLTPSKGFDILLLLSILTIGVMAARVVWVTWIKFQDSIGG